MVATNKWIDGRPDEAAHKVARRALKKHFSRMSHYLEQAVCASPVDAENVHQLRVSSRRAAAVIEIFAEWLPKKRKDWTEKQVRKIRKAAGAARDCDVLLERWTEHMRHTPSSHAALLMEQIKFRRRLAQEPIEEIHKHLVRKRFGRRAKKLTKRLRSRSGTQKCGKRFVCFARIMLGRLVASFLKAGGAQLEDAAVMHAFRIQSKQLRYAMEVFAGAFDEPFRRELYPLVVALQDRLGAINDHVTAQTYFAEWHSQAESPAVRAALETAIEQEQQALEASRREFLDWWTTERREEFGRRFAPYIEVAIAEPADTPADSPPGCDSSGND
jgi:CHAD domain-containing protein